MKIRTSISLWLAAAMIAGTAPAEAPKAAAPKTDAPKLAAKPVSATAKKLANLPSALSEAAVKAHVVSPSNIKNIQMEEVDEAKEVRLSVAAKKLTFKKTPKLNVGAFGTAMHTLLKDNVVGYMLQVRQNDQLVYNLIWNFAQTPADANKGWNENTRMHVASVSKYLTAVGMVKVLDSKNISYDAKIAGYLPSHWCRGNNIDKITFRHLLQHKSGFSTGGSSSDYAFMKARVAGGVPGVGGYDYENMNFGLMRLLIPIINGDVPKNATFVSDAALNDQAWDAVTLYHYKSYMQSKVFTPAGVANVDFAPANPNALAYVFPNSGAKGWNSGDLASVAGGAAWRLSTKELLNVMGTIRRKNSIIPADKAQYILDNYFGIDQAIDTPAGKIYNKNGAWGTGDGKTEQCVAYFLPNNTEVVVFVNSKIGAQNFSLRGLVKDVYLNSLAE
jgi:CubicO group peptidase (beta-lactamase class C family)